MPDWLPAQFATLFVGVVIAIVTSVTTVVLTLRRFRAEQIWVRRADAYHKSLTAMHTVKRDCAADWRAAERQTERKQSEESLKAVHDAHQQIKEAIDLSSFLMSREATRCLERLDRGLSDARDAPDYYEHLAVLGDSVEAALKELSEIARSDLGIGLRVIGSCSYKHGPSSGGAIEVTGTTLPGASPSTRLEIRILDYEVVD